MTTEKTFEARYEIDDGYAGGSRPHYFVISAGDLEDDMTDDDLEAFYEELCDEHMQQNIGCSPSRVDQFVEWAKQVIAVRQQEASHE